MQLQKPQIESLAPNVLATSTITRFPHNLPEKYPLVCGQDGKAYLVLSTSTGNPRVLRIGSLQANNLVRFHAQAEGKPLRNHELAEINEYLTAQALMSGEIKPIWSRVAPIEDGIEIDMCDADNMRIKVTAGKVDVITKDSNILFFRNPISQPMVIPSERGNIDLLKKYVNLSSVDFVLFIAWISYTLAHPKARSTNYVILVLQGDQGTGKSFMCRYVISNLIDPSRVDVQAFPKSAKDLSIAGQHAHVLCYDNMRGFKSQMSDTLCMASTGGAISNRTLYTDGDQNVHHLHVALVLNGIHSFINQSDLAQRCLSIRTLAMPESNRKSEAEMVKAFESDLPIIFRGLLDLIASAFKALPDAKVIHPERMLDFVKWLAAMEIVHDAPEGAYQAVYSDVLHQSQLDTLLDNLLAATIMEFAEQHSDWTGTPAAFLNALEFIAEDGAKRSPDWPSNAISLSKRLNALKASLLTQGISVELTRGKQRTITIKSI